ncbi:hypothetical protein ABID59_000145 [Bradyrhizobium sp. S3.3.6]|uniref:hypothetical protein n=1 Tax=Bradyrhizobium sp. S3.3.6 TaxID=3156429 RepID=UPI0033911270
MRVSLRQTAFVAAVLSLAALASTGSAGAADLPANGADLPVKAKAPAELPFFRVIDDRVTFAYAPDAVFAGQYARNPDGTYNAKTSKQTYAFTHFDVWAYGTNRVNITLDKYGHGVAANPCTNVGVIRGVATTPDCAGASFGSGSLRSTFDWNEIFNTKAFTIGPLHNISFVVGADATVSNIYTAHAKRAFMGGLQFAFDLPYKGYVNVAPMVYKDFGHNANLQCGVTAATVNVGVNCTENGNTDFPTTWALETSYYMDLGFLPENMRFWSISGRATWIGGNGNQNSPLLTGANRATSFDTEPLRLTLDASKAFMGPKYSHLVDVWVSYRYSQNKANYDHNVSSLCVVNGVSDHSCTESTLYTGVTVKF